MNDCLYPNFDETIIGYLDCANYASPGRSIIQFEATPHVKSRLKEIAEKYLSKFPNGIYPTTVNKEKQLSHWADGWYAELAVAAFLKLPKEFHTDRDRDAGFDLFVPSAGWSVGVRCTEMSVGLGMLLRGNGNPLKVNWTFLCYVRGHSCYIWGAIKAEDFAKKCVEHPNRVGLWGVPASEVPPLWYFASQLAVTPHDFAFKQPLLDQSDHHFAESNSATNNRLSGNWS